MSSSHQKRFGNDGWVSVVVGAPMGPDISFRVYSPERDYIMLIEECLQEIVNRIAEQPADIREAIPPADPEGAFNNGVWCTRRIYYTGLNHNAVRQIIEDVFAEVEDLDEQA